MSLSADTRVRHQAIAVSFALLLVLSLIASPALAAGVASQPPAQSNTHHTDSAGPTWSPPDTVVTASTNRTNATDAYNDLSEGSVDTNFGTHPLEQNITIPEIEANSTVALLRNARTTIAELNTTEDYPSTLKRDALVALNESIDEYRAGFFADSTDALYYQEQALASLNELLVLGANETALETAATEIETASNVSATLAHYQAQQTIRAHQNDLDGFQYTQAVIALDNAATERDWGDDADSSTTAIWHYRVAWEHAQIALDTVEESVDPALSLEHGPAIETNGTYETTVYISLSDIRPYRYENATLTFENGETRTVSLTGGNMADSRARATVDVALGEELANRTVTVSATSRRQPFLGVCFTLGNCERTVEETLEISIDENNVIPDRPAPDEEVEVEVEDDESGAVVDVEGPGLIEDDISIEDRTPENDTAFRASPVVRVENRSEITEATVRLPVETDSETAQENLSMYTWDPTRADGSGWTEIDGEYNPETGMFSADVEHFSFFAVFDSAEWNNALTETITLEDRHVVGNLGDDENETELLKSDFVFTIDTSGSMSGDQISYAKQASKRFVAALYEDEKAGLVSFDSSARVEQSLTTDHDALNESIDSLSAGGGTDMSEGISTAIGMTVDQLIAYGNEDRPSQMIVLADGKTDRQSSVAAAEEAAEHNITINTVGLTNAIDEGVLEEVASVTGGEFYHVEDVEDLPDTFERIADDASIELVDSSNDGIPDAVADANPPIPQLLAIDSYPDRSDYEYPGINIDPLQSDTSGDGILDNETIDVEYRVFEEDGELKLETKVTNAEHHPARRDTTGDGLPDRRQVEGWEIAVIRDHNDAQQMVEATDTDSAEFFTPVDVTANPFALDTDGDGLDDVEEHSRGTDPRREYTVGDGISDLEAVRHPDLDPTVAKVTPPQVTRVDPPRTELTIEGGDLRVRYQYVYVVRDSLWVKNVTLIHGLHRVHDEPEIPRPEVSTFITSYTVDWKQGILDEFAGFQTQIIARDGLGNELNEPLYQESDWAVQLAEQTPLPSGESVGKVSGFSAGAAEIPEFLLMVQEHPRQLAEALLDVNLGVDVLVEMIQNLPQQVIQQQHQANPHEPQGEARQNPAVCVYEPENSDYCAFANGWFEGYSLYKVTEMVASAGLGSTTSIDDVVTTLRRVRDRVTSLRTFLADRELTFTNKANYRLMTDGGRDYSDLDVQFQTAGKNARAIQEFDQVRHLDELAPDQQTLLLRQLADVADARATRQFLNELEDVDDVRFLLDEDVTTINRLTRWHANPDAHRHIDPDLTADNLVHVARNGNVGEVREMVIRGADDFQETGSVQWLETGDDTKGLQHILQRHATDDQFYAIDGIDSVEDVKDAIYTTVKNGDPHQIPSDNGGGTAYVYSYASGSDITVIVGDNGFIVSARPGDYP